MYEDQYSLHFDEYARFRAVAELINNLREEGLTVLDVGGGHGRFLNFLARHPAVSVDKQNGVDGTRLPFADNSFDVVTSIDALEHVLKEDRPMFITEMVRVARAKAFLAFPHSEATEATNMLNRFTNYWLIEHIQLGLPSQEDVERVLTELGVSFRKYYNLDLATWVTMTIAEFFAPVELKTALNENFNQHFYGREMPSSCYRVIYEIDC